MQVDYGKSSLMIALVKFRIIDNDLGMNFIVLIIVGKIFSDYVDSPQPCIVVIKTMVQTLAIIILAAFGPFGHAASSLAAPPRVVCRTLCCWLSFFA